MSDVENDEWRLLALARIDAVILSISKGVAVETSRTACPVCTWASQKKFQDGIRCPTGRWNPHFPVHCPAAHSCRIFVKTVHKFVRPKTKIKHLRGLRQDVEEHIL